MISEKMKKLVGGSSAIRAMFEEGKRLAAIYGRENVYDYSLGNPNFPAPAAVNLAAGEQVRAPMPGNILRVDVKQGDAVKAGQVLVILEAMKMENEIVAPKDGTVAQVVTKVGDKVDTGAALVVIA